MSLSFFPGTPARGVLLLASLTASFAAAPAQVVAEDASAVEGRLADSAKYLSSDDLEGRGVGTMGLDKAADYIAGQFREIGLKTDVVEGQPFQKFAMTTGATLGSPNTLELIGPAGADGEPRKIELKLGDDFNPLAIGGSGTFDLPLVFVGYGITADEEDYDDYAGIDVKDKAVVILRHEPQQGNPHSVFDGTKVSQYAPFRRKVSNAYEHGAAAVIFCTDAYDIQNSVEALRNRWQVAVDEIVAADARFKKLEDPTDDDREKHQNKIKHLTEDLNRYAAELEAAKDPLLPFDGAGRDSAEARDFPIVACRREALEPAIEAALGTTLAELEAEIDKGPTPRSRELTGWRAVGQTAVDREETEVKNVVGVLEGEGPHADETIVIGAHYDHLGFGGAGSAAHGVVEIHNGADDNGSGTSVLVEVARQLAARGEKLPRRIVFIAFTGEERGLVGSARYVRNPLFPLDSTVAMLNLDMVGRLTDDKLIVHGTGTAKEFDQLVDRYGKQFEFAVTKKPDGFGPSDHSSFYAAKIPVLFFFTGSHKDYHRPSDDFEKLNISGMRRIGEMVGDIAVELAQADGRPEYRQVAGAGDFTTGGDRPYFGSIPDFSQDRPGYALTGVSKNGPAERAGLKAGDIIVQFGESKIGNLEDFDSALRKYKAGDNVPVTVERGSEQLKLEVTLDPPR